MRPPTHTRVAVDSHIYSMFERHTIAFSDQQRIEYYCNKRSILSGWHPWTVIGEWTAATTDCGGKLPGIDYVSPSHSEIDDMCANLVCSGDSERILTQPAVGLDLMVHIKTGQRLVLVTERPAIIQTGHKRIKIPYASPSRYKRPCTKNRQLVGYIGSALIPYSSAVTCS